MTQIFFIGGSPCSGKSSVAASIADTFDFNYFKVDDHLERYLAKGRLDGKPVCARVGGMTADQIWMREPAIQMMEEFEIYREIFAYVVQDLNDLRYRTRKAGIIAEGAAFLPELMAFLPELMEKRGVGQQAYICMIPTSEFQNDHYRNRPWVADVLADCADKAQAFSNWMMRDVLFARAVRMDAANKGYPCIITDGKTGIGETVQQVCRSFGLTKGGR